MKCYGFEGDERLETDPDEVVQRYMDSLAEPDESFERFTVRVNWPLVVLVFRRMDVGRHADSIARNALDDALERLDEEYGDPDGTPSEPTEKMKSAAMAFAKDLLAEYVVWACEPTGETVEYTAEQARKIWEGLV